MQVHTLSERTFCSAQICCKKLYSVQRRILFHVAVHAICTDVCQEATGVKTQADKRNMCVSPVWVLIGEGRGVCGGVGGRVEVGRSLTEACRLERDSWC